MNTLLELLMIGGTLVMFYVMVKVAWRIATFPVRVIVRQVVNEERRDNRN